MAAQTAVSTKEGHPSLAMLPASWRAIPVVQPHWTHAAEAPEEASELMSRLDEVMDQEGNRVCAECPIQHPQWAVLDRGIFVCSLCAGVHREGVSKRVRSVAYDSSTWADEANVALMEKKGNAKHNALYASKTGKLPPPPSDPTYPQMREYIFEKYSFTPSVAAGSAGKQLAAAPTCGMLFVTAVSAAKLKNRDTGIGGDVSDPFLKVTLGDQVVKSSIVQDSLDPVWDQELDALKWDGMSLLQLEVLDYDKFTSDDTLGKVVIDLDNIPDSGEDEAGIQHLTLSLAGDHALPGSTVSVSLQYKDLRKW